MYSVMAMGMSLWLWDFPFTIKHKAVNVYRHRILRPAVLFLHFQHQVQTFLIDKWKEFTCSFTKVYKVSSLYHCKTVLTKASSYEQNEKAINPSVNPLHIYCKSK